MFLALGYLVEVPRHKRDDTKRNGNKQDENDYEESPAASSRSRVAGTECMVMVMVDFDSSIAAMIGRRIRIDCNSFVTLI